MVRNRIKFTEIANVLPYPPKYKATLSTIHSDVIDYVSKHFTLTKRCKEQSLLAIHITSYYIVQDESIPKSIDMENLFETLPEEPDDMVSVLKKYNIYLTDKDISWDLHECTEEQTTQYNKIENKPVIAETTPPIATREKMLNVTDDSLKAYVTLKPPVVPRFDPNSILVAYTKFGNRYEIYESLPKIPTRQCEISMTTRLENMTETDLLKLFPKAIIQTRYANCYKHYDFLEYDERLGSILQIDGYTREQIIDNIVKYPHFYALKKLNADGEEIGFFSTIEIDGELQDTFSVWDSLEVSKYVPRVSDLIREYVARRYLLERDIKGIKHKFPMVGELDPFITLFMPASMYADYGYGSPIYLAESCVKSRVSFRISRNPVMKGLAE